MSILKKCLKSIKRTLNYALGKHCARKLERTFSVNSFSVVDPSSRAVVSLTSYGDRIKTVHLTIESIACGSVLPKRLILWIDEEETLRDLPSPLKRLQDCGLEILGCENYGSYTKFYPFVISQDLSLPLVTADDDIFYPKDWLKNLVVAHVKNPDAIYCYRARRISFDSDGFAPYKSWRLIYKSDKPSALNFATGVSGVIYPPRFLRILKEAGDGFLQTCPKGDDIWLHKQAIGAEFRIAVIEGMRKIIYIPGTQRIMLTSYNYHQDGNDLQIRATYEKADTTLLREALANGD
ncbi:MAG: hypothetical protein LBF86_04185 [Helicobacteraceae bacterium]|jgi:hypothetical protein|nr:hypothetical protein [Helicobacteraceae bacterium]